MSQDAHRERSCAEKRYGDAFLLFQIPDFYTSSTTHPTIPWPACLDIVDRHGAVVAVGPEVERCAKLDAVVETVDESF